MHYDILLLLLLLLLLLHSAVGQKNDAGSLTSVVSTRKLDMRVAAPTRLMIMERTKSFISSADPSLQGFDSGFSDLGDYDAGTWLIVAY